jgi:hypothetical protein
MKYRIKTITHNTGKKEYIAEVKRFFKWVSIGDDGIERSCKQVHYTRKNALCSIDEHYEMNPTPQKIEFEYFTK